MIGFFSLYHDDKVVVMKDKLHFVHIPDELSKDEIEIQFAKMAKLMAEKFDANLIYLNFGKDDFIKYEYEI